MIEDFRRLSQLYIILFITYPKCFLPRVTFSERLHLLLSQNFPKLGLLFRHCKFLTSVSFLPLYKDFIMKVTLHVYEGSTHAALLVCGRLKLFISSAHLLYSNSFCTTSSCLPSLLRSSRNTNSSVTHARTQRFCCPTF